MAADAACSGRWRWRLLETPAPNAGRPRTAAAAVLAHCLDAGSSGAQQGLPRQGCPSSAPVRGADTQRGSGEVAIDTDFCDNADRLAAPRARPAMSLAAATAVGSTETGCRETLQLPALCPEAFGQGSAKCLFCLLFTRTGTPIAYGVRHRWTCRPALCS